ncbi:hypothetical protein V5O48_018834 [Marasmius crinis-equi]|uniref:Uncharacterized protein n=1 Tax=Marasmius crinis-equi TaxID=585013 RepID=A0ABR3EK74_9AGAR
MEPRSPAEINFCLDMSTDSTLLRTVLEHEKGEIHAFTDNMTPSLTWYLETLLPQYVAVLSCRDSNFIQYQSFMDTLIDTWLNIILPAEWKTWPIRKLQYLRRRLRLRFIGYFDRKLSTHAGLHRFVRGVLPLAPPGSPVLGQAAPTRLGLYPFILNMANSESVSWSQ